MHINERYREVGLDGSEFMMVVFDVILNSSASFRLILKFQILLHIHDFRIMLCVV